MSHLKSRTGKKKSFRVKGRLGDTYLQDEILSSLLNYVSSLKNDYLLPSLFSFQPWNVKNSFNRHFFFFGGKDEIIFLVCDFVQRERVAEQVFLSFPPPAPFPGPVELCCSMFRSQKAAWCPSSLKRTIERPSLVFHYLFLHSPLFNMEKKPPTFVK